MPLVAFGVKVPSGTFSPGTVAACSVTTPESEEAQLVIKTLMAESKTMQIGKRRIITAKN
jgi:hypothetical protein